MSDDTQPKQSMIPITNIPGLENAYQVDPKILWRSAQPPDSAYPLLAAAGCQAVIDLNNSGDEVNRQRGLVIAAGMIYMAFDWSGWEVPNQTEVRCVIGTLDRIIGMKPSAPILVHCEHGSDRTGVVCACWRLHHDGWDFDSAMHEAFFSLGSQGMHEVWFTAAVAIYSAQILGRIPKLNPPATK